MAVDTAEVSDFLLPSLGSDMEEGSVIEWLVEVGDAVTKGQVLLRVDTEKAEIEVEVWYDGVDQDCADDGDTEADYDADGDGYQAEGYGVGTDDDCDDTESTVNPGATDYYYDGIDQDCDGTSDFEYAGDGYPSDG